MNTWPTSICVHTHTHTDWSEEELAFLQDMAMDVPLDDLAVSPVPPPPPALKAYDNSAQVCVCICMCVPFPLPSPLCSMPKTLHICAGVSMHVCDASPPSPCTQGICQLTQADNDMGVAKK